MTEVQLQQVVAGVLISKQYKELIMHPLAESGIQICKEGIEQTNFYLQWAISNSLSEYIQELYSDLSRWEACLKEWTELL